MSDATIILHALADRLGLPVVHQRISGFLDGAPLSVEVRVRFRNPGASTHVVDLTTGTVRTVRPETLLWVEATLPFRPRLDAGLKVAAIGGLQALSSAGRTGFAARFAVDGAEPDRVEALTGSVREPIDRAFVVDPGPSVTDAGVTWTASSPAPWPEVDVLAAAIRELPAIWRGVVDAGARVRPPTGTEEAMVHLAHADRPAGVEMRGCPAGLVGAVDGLDLSLTVAPAVEGVLARFSVALPAVVPGGPEVVREDRFGWFDRLFALLEGRREITVGDREFDRRFAVRSLRPDALRELLSPDVQAALLALDPLVPVRLGAAAVDGHGRVPPDRLPVVAEAVFRLGRALAA